MIKRVLFVDDEPQLLSGLECMLRKMRSEWKMSFALGGREAFELLEKETFDVVVTDLHMPGLDGLELLDAVKTRAPNSVRIILSGTTARDSVLRSASGAHQFLAKPCNPETLKAVVRRAFALRERLTEERLLRVASQLESLPALPTLYLEIQELLRSPSCSIEGVGRLVARDVSMSAKVLHLANSAFFGAARSFSNATEATVYLGLDTVSALVLTTQLFARRSTLEPETMQRIWDHCLRTGSMARAILELERLDRKVADQAFLAGLLHEAGLLVMATDIPEQLTQAWKHARRLGVPLAEAERRLTGTSRAAVGAYLMGLWNMPDPVVEAIAFHPTPSAVPPEGITPLTAVHVAAAFANAAGGPFGSTGSTLDVDYLQRLGVAERLSVWREHCRAMLTSSAA